MVVIKNNLKRLEAKNETNIICMTRSFRKYHLPKDHICIYSLKRYFNQILHIQPTYILIISEYVRDFISQMSRKII